MCSKCNHVIEETVVGNLKAVFIGKVIFLAVLEIIILELDKQEENIPSRKNSKGKYFKKMKYLKNNLKI